MPDKLFRDPLYDYIAIDTNTQNWILQLINCPEVQRLRYISQLGLAQFVYPGANHSRFSHSLGVLHLMQQCLTHLERDYPRFFKRLDKQALLAAALLHDIGHAPFSHATEKFFGNHEQRAVEIIQNPSSHIHKVLSSRARTLPAKVAALLGKKDTTKFWQKSLISSQLDMDRLDYLRRDSLCSGAEYGNFDWFRLIHTMQLKERKLPRGRGQKEQVVTEVVWPDKTKFALEEYIFSRFYMYESVYFHHTSRGFESLLRKTLQRGRDCAIKSKQFRKTLVAPIPGVTPPQKSLDPTLFSKLTDHTLIAQIGIWQDSKDKTLADLSKRLIARKVFAWHPVEKTAGFEMANKVNAVREYLKKKRLDPQYYFFEDKAELSVYSPYRADASHEELSSLTSILLFDQSYDAPHFCEITNVPGLQRLQAVTQAQTPIIRYYFPKEHEDQIKKRLH